MGMNRGKSWANPAGTRIGSALAPFHCLAGEASDHLASARLTEPVLSSCRARHGSNVMAARTNFRGSFTALVTPFKNGGVDEEAFRNIVEWQIGEGTNGLVPVGTTGESPTLSHQEHKQVVEWC